MKINTIIGHRGCDSAAQENTLEAFLQAYELGAEWVEMDIRKTRDDIYVLWHDEEINGVRIRGALFEELNQIAIDSGLKLDKFEDVLKKLEELNSTNQSPIKLDLELKEAGYEKEIIGLILKYYIPAEFSVKSFWDESLIIIKKYFPTIKTGLLLGQKRRVGENNFQYLKRRLSEVMPWQRLKNTGVDFVSLHYHLAKFAVHKIAFRKGYQVQIWTLNSAKKIKEFMLSSVVNGIVTDKPELAKKIYKQL